MKKLTFFAALLLFIGFNAYGQKQNAKPLKQVMTLKIDREGGANGASVAWHPVQKKYYAAMAGNISFPMEVFDANGKMLSNDTLETMFDVRGLWYNPATKTLQSNGYDDFGWSEYKLNAKGIPVANRKLTVVTSQPDPQSVGAYDAKKNVVYFYDAQSTGIERHKMKDGTSDTTILLHPGIKNKADIDGGLEDTKENYNGNAIIFTGIPHSEIGLLNVREAKIELYNIADGLLTKELKLPDDAPVQASLNFCFTNGIYWLFDKTERIWHGYK
jgi:hypothetical protein